MNINDTPVRTAKNYGINDVSIELPEEKTAFLNKINENISNLSAFDQNFSKNDNNQNDAAKFEGCTLSNNFAQNLIENHAEIKNENRMSAALLAEAKLYGNFNKSIEIASSSNEIHKISFNFDKNNSNLVGALNLTIKNGVKTNLVLQFCGNQSLQSYQNFNIKIDVEENADANIIVYTELGESSSNLMAIQSDVQKNAKLNITFLDIACKNSIFNYKSKILGESGESNLNTLYLGDRDSLIDLNYLIEVFAPHGKTNLEISGAIADNARKHFKGTIDFKKGCPKSVGAENEYCMMLSNTTKSKALPMILCTEEDVDGKHSSSVGKVDEKQLFYIMSRGLTQIEATRLIIKAKFNNIIDKLFDKDLTLKILDIIDRKIK